MRVRLSLRAGTVMVGAVLALALAVGSAQAVPEQFSFLPGAEGFDGSLSAGEPLSSPGMFSFPFFDAEDPGPAAIQAGSHPYALTVGFASENTLKSLPQYPKGMTAKDLEETRPKLGEGTPTSNVRDVTVNLPRGVIVDPDAVTTRCTPAQLANTAPAIEKEGGEVCPVSSTVGVATLYDDLSPGIPIVEERIPVFSMVPPVGVPAEFGFNVPVLSGLSVILKGRVRTGGDYGLSAEVSNTIAKLPILGVSVTLWGVPSDPSHDSERGYCASEDGQLELEQGLIAPCSTERTNTALLTMPSSCSGSLATTIEADSWQQPGVLAHDSFQTHGETEAWKNPWAWKAARQCRSRRRSRWNRSNRKSPRPTRRADCGSTCTCRRTSSTASSLRQTSRTRS